MQFGSGYGAQTVLLPQEADELTARAAQAREQTIQSQQQSQLGAATLPDKIAMSGLALADARSASQLKTTGNQQAMIANAASLATTPEEWDDAMQGLADKGVPQARQFIGRFSQQLKGRVTNAYGASSPQSALAAMQSDSPTGAGGAQSGLADVAGGGGSGVNEGASPGPFDQQLAQLPAPAIKALYDKTERIRAAVQTVAQSQNPQVEWDKEAADMGHPEWVGKYSPQALQQLTQETIPLSNYLRGRMTREGLGMPAAKLPAAVDNVGGALYAIDRSDPAHPKATPITPQGKGTLVGTDPDTGVGIYYDPVTGKETKGTEKLAAKPGVTGRTSVYAQKQQAWLDVHPGDTAGALSYASGQHNMTAPQARTAAAAQAARDLQAIALGGGTVADPQAFLQQAEDEHFAETMASRGAAGVGAPPASPASGRGALAGSAAWTALQRAAVGRYPKNPTAEAGSKGRPFVPTNATEYGKIAAGHWFIDSDGTLVQKKAP